jgi:hypothetical protein
MWGYNTSSNPNINPWTNAVGKICPGPGKIREFPDLLASVARRVNGGAEEEPVTPAEIDAIAKKVWDTLIDNVSDPKAADVPARTALAYVLRNTAATYLGTSDAAIAVSNALQGLKLQAQEIIDAINALEPGEGGGEGTPPAGLSFTFTGTAVTGTAATT